MVLHLVSFPQVLKWLKLLRCHTWLQCLIWLKWVKCLSSHNFSSCHFLLTLDLMLLSHKQDLVLTTISGGTISSIKARGRNLTLDFSIILQPMLSLNIRLIFRVSVLKCHHWRLIILCSFVKFVIKKDIQHYIAFNMDVKLIYNRASHTAATCFNKGNSPMSMSQPMSQQFQAHCSQVHHPVQNVTP